MNLIAACKRAGARGALVAVVVFALTAAAGAARAAERLHTFDIPAQAASSALLELCLQADCELAFTAQPGRAAQTRAIRGRMHWRTAVSRMLAGTGLGYRFVGERGVRIWAEPTAARSAPDPPDVAQVGELVVVARLSDQLDQALAEKRAADVISDGLSAERIGDLPAANLAEALQRVPGVAIEREVGEGQFVSVRGLGPLFQSVTLNGAPVAFNENIRNSTQSGRQFRFRALSVDLLSGARLTKTSTPDLVDGGIGSNIDIRTAGGLDGEPFVSLRIGGGTEARTGQVSGDFALAGRRVSADGQFGIVGGLSEEARSVRYDRFQIMRYGQTLIDGRTLAAPNDVRTTVEQETRRRRSLFVGADWQATRDLALDFDVLASTFDNAIREDRLVYGLGERLAEPGAILRVEDGVVTAAQIAAGRIDNNTEFSDQAHLNLVVSLGGEARLGQWRLASRLSGSSAHSVLDTPLERFSAQSPEGVSYVFDLGDAGDTRRAARLTTDFDLLDPGRLTLAQLGIRAVESRDQDVTYVLDAGRALEVNWGGLRLSRLTLGVQASERSRDYDRRDRRATSLAADEDLGRLYVGTTPDDVFADLVADRAAPWIVADFDRLRSAFAAPGGFGDIVFRPRDVAPAGADLQNSYAVEEGVRAAHIRLDLDGVLAGRPVFGNAGLRLVATRTRVEGARLEAADDVALVRPVAFEGQHDILLPSLNLAFDLDAASVLRVAASRSITRPSLADLRASTVPASVLVSAIYERGAEAITDPGDGVIFSGVGGNPSLTPYVSTNFDLSYEVTRRSTSYSLAYFHKRIDDFVQTVEAPERLTFETRQGPAVEAEVLMARPQNVGAATIDGVEVGLHHRLAEGLGLWASATWTDSRLADGARLTGVSDWAWAISPYYERGPLALNLSWSWRSAFRSEADLQGGGVSDFLVAAAGYLDAQASYALSSGAEFVLSGSNLTDTRELAYDGDETRLLQLGSVGRQVSFGLRWVW